MYDSAIAVGYNFCGTEGYGLQAYLPQSIAWEPAMGKILLFFAVRHGYRFSDRTYILDSLNFYIFDTASGSWVIGAGWCVDATGEEVGRNPDKYGLTEDDCFKLCLTNTDLNGCASLDDNLCVTYTGNIKGSNGNVYYKCYYRTGIN